MPCATCEHLLCCPAALRCRGFSWVAAAAAHTLREPIQARVREDEDDEDDEHWVREQLRKGAGPASAGQLPGGGADGRERRGAAAGAPGRAGGAAAQQEDVSAAGEGVLRALRQGLARLQARPATLGQGSKFRGFQVWL